MGKEPLFNTDSTVSFSIDGIIRRGIIENYDSHAFGYNEIVYDIYVEDEQCIYKHVRESEILTILDSIENDEHDGKPVMPSELPKGKFDFRGLIAYADKKGVKPNELSDEEKSQFVQIDDAGED